MNNASFTTTLLEKYNENKKRGLPNDFTLADIKGAAGAIIIAGGDTVGDAKAEIAINIANYPSDIDYSSCFLSHDDGESRSTAKGTS